MATTFESTMLIDSRDVDGMSRCKASALMGLLQECATQAAEAGGFTREVLLKNYGAFWMLTRFWVRLNRPLKWEENVRIVTYHRGAGHGVTMYRDYDLYVGDEQVGEAVSAWVLANQENRKMLRLSTIKEIEGTDGGELCKTLRLRKLRKPETLHQVEQRPMRYSDTDINGHVNNTRYADFACDTLRLDRLPENQFLSEFQIDYVAECRPGEVITMEAGPAERGQYVCGLDNTGKARFEALLIFGEVVP